MRNDSILYKAARVTTSAALVGTMVFGMIPAPALAQMTEEAAGQEQAQPGDAQGSGQESTEGGGQAIVLPDGPGDALPPSDDVADDQVEPGDSADPADSTAPTDGTRESSADAQEDKAPANPNDEEAAKLEEMDVVILAAQSDPVQTSGTWGECVWEFNGSTGLLSIRPGSQGNKGAPAQDGKYPWSDYYSSIKRVEVQANSGKSVIAPQDSTRLFADLYNATSIDLRGLSTVGVTNMSEMFNYCFELASLDVSGLDTSRVTNMSSMFGGCSDLDELYVSNFDTSRVTDMSRMFSACYSLDELDVSQWNTSRVTDMSYTFYDCAALTSLDVSNWNTSRVTNMSSMFSACSDLVELDVSNWNTSNVTDMDCMFCDCSDLVELDVSNWNTSNVTDMYNLFAYCSSLSSLDVSDWNTSNVTSMTRLFRDCSSLTSLDVSGWNTSRVTSMAHMFADCTRLGSLNVKNWNTTQVQSVSAMFAYCSALTSLDLSGWDTSKVKYAAFFDGCMQDPAMFEGCTKLKLIKVGAKYRMCDANMVPGATAKSGKWWSYALQKWLTKGEIASKRSRVADTYTNYENRKPSLSSATVSAIANQAYTGKAICPKPTVKLSGKTLRLNTDYTLAYANNVKAGTATITVTGKGAYAGAKRTTFKIVAPSIRYRTHVQSIGNQSWRSNGAVSGTSGKSKRLEGIWIELPARPVSGSITYRTHVQSYGWRGWSSAGKMSGSKGEAKRLEAIQIKLTGNMAKLYDVYYRVHAQRFGWMGWAKNGQQAGTAGYAYRLEAIQIVLVPKGVKGPGATYKNVRQSYARAFAQRR